MKKGSSLLLMALLAVHMPTRSAWGNFSDWLNTLTNRITYASGGANYLVGHATQPESGCFAQLIHTGPDGQIAPALATRDGVSSDDVVVATAWVGRYMFSSPHGRLLGGSYSGGTEGWLYYVRLWTAPSPDYTNGWVPSFPTNRYGDSTLKAYPAAEAPPEEFNFGGPTGFSTVLKPMIVDSDTNGLPDWWEYTYFKVFTHTDPGADADTDTVANVEEYRAGTDPTKAWSLFEFDAVGLVAPSNRVVRWSAEAGHLYALERGTNDYSQATNRAFSFAPVTNGLSTADGWLAYTDRVDGAGPYFYRVATQPFTNW